MHSPETSSRFKFEWYRNKSYQLLNTTYSKLLTSGRRKERTQRGDTSDPICLRYTLESHLNKYFDVELKRSDKFRIPTKLLLTNLGTTRISAVSSVCEVVLFLSMIQL